MPGNYVYLEVADNGCGMSEDTMRHVFEPFFTTKFSGRGLGMAAVTGIMRGHHGAIRVRSQLGVGTTFRAIFPFASPKKGELGEGDPASAAKGALSSWTGLGTILFADDEDQVRDVGRRILERLGFSVVCARDGNEAVTAFAESPDLFERVILDLSMPGMDGIETWAHDARDQARRQRGHLQRAWPTGDSPARCPPPTRRRHREALRDPGDDDVPQVP